MKYFEADAIVCVYIKDCVAAKNKIDAIRELHKFHAGPDGPIKNIRLKSIDKKKYEESTGEIQDDPELREE